VICFDDNIDLDAEYCRPPVGDFHIYSAYSQSFELSVKNKEKMKQKQYKIFSVWTNRYHFLLKSSKQSLSYLSWPLRVHKYVVVYSCNIYVDEFLLTMDTVS